VMIAPGFVGRAMVTYADIPLGYLVAGAALLVVLWVDEREPWQLAGATLLLSAGVLTKREGMLFAASVLVAALLASWGDRRGGWRPVALSGIVVVALTLPWRLWFTARGLPSDGPEAGYGGSLDHLDRVGPSFRLVLRTLFDQDLWPVVSLVGVAAVLLAALAGSMRAAVFGATFLGGAVAACTWAIWSNPSLQFTQQDSLNPIVRLTGTTILVLGAMTPLLLQNAWDGSREDRSARPVAVSPGPDGIVWRSLGAWAIVLVGVLSHPASMLAGYSGSGLPGGTPAFAGPGACVLAAAPGPPAQRVVGYASSYAAADELRRRAVATGANDVRMEQDGCGRIRVFLGSG
jgi:hypothetical protein